MVDINSKLPFILVLCTASCICLYPNDAIAQENSQLYNHFQEPSYQELNLNEDKPLIYELNDSKSTKTKQIIKRDTVAINAARNKGASKQAEKNEGDALSFNFLYYIIQKYKISDIVDQ
ncbi:MAG TPA: hypothetical protein DIW27_00140 [Cytophagales bacterium]|nr:hypothetical protein [Cytophagales bacterium]